MYALRSHTAPYAIWRCVHKCIILDILHRSSVRRKLFKNINHSGRSFGTEHITMVHTAWKDVAMINIQRRKRNHLSQLLSVHFACRFAPCAQCSCSFCLVLHRENRRFSCSSRGGSIINIPWPFQLFLFAFEPHRSAR